MASASTPPYSATSDTVLSVKVTMPGSCGELVDREWLLKKMGCAPRPLTVVHAPAGFGKTTLLTTWLKQTGLPVAWLSLDENDNDPLCFTRYLIASIMTLFPDFGGQLGNMLSSPHPPTASSVLPLLLKELENGVTQPFIIAFDDYHVVENSAVHRILTGILEHRPAQLHIAMTSRTEPPLPLPRLRVRRQLAEITDSDLRFSFSEAADFLNRIANLSLTEQHISVLAARTEGWIAGLQLAALSLEKEHNRAAFICAFAGDDRYIMDYLTGEVLQRQPPEVQQFLLQTSILERVNGSLCDAVTETSNSVQQLAFLEKSNMFLIALDNKRNWYRYHHLFADLLRKQLDLGGQTRIKSLHLRASHWFNENSYPHEAVSHAFKAEAYEQAALVIDTHGKRLFEKGQSPILRDWYQRIPVSYIKGNPCRTLQYAWSLFISNGELPHDLLEELQTAFHTGELELKPQEFKAIETDLVLLGGFQSMQQGDVSLAGEQAEQAIELCQQTGDMHQLAPKLLYAVAILSKGEVVQAEQLFMQLMDEAFSDEYLIALNATICGLGRSLILQGHLGKAEACLKTGLKRLQEKGWDRSLRDVAWLYLAMGDLAYQRNQLDLSLSYIEQAAEVVAQEQWGTILGMIAIRRARIFHAKGQLDEVDNCYHYIASLEITPALLPFFSTVQDDCVALSLARGEQKEPEKWMAERSLSLDSKPQPEKEYEYIQLVRMLKGCGRLDQAIKLIAALLIAAEQGHRRQIVIELLILQALVRQTQGQTKRAVDSLQRSLGYAEPEGYLRLFLDEGAPMLALLKRASVNHSYADLVLSHFGENNSPSPDGQNRQGNVEPLSKKEYKTLELLVAGLSNREIAQQLHVSSNTVKTHIKNIYAKLRVGSRMQAVIRVKELGLL